MSALDKYNPETSIFTHFKIEEGLEKADKAFATWQALLSAKRSHDGLFLVILCYNEDMPYKIHEFTCPNCDTKFLRRAKKAHFCSRACQNTAQKTGQIPANKCIYPINCLYCGKKFQPANHTIRHCSGSCGRMGKPSWNKGKEYLAIRGENHPNWKGGVSKINKTKRQLAMYTLEYKKWRTAVFERDSYTCVHCGVGGKLDADHIKPWSLFPKLRYKVSNGRSLCRKCHIKTPTYGYHGKKTL